MRLVPWRPEWASRFESERERIAGALGDTAELIEHIGSTAVPGLDAKPIVDILVAVADPTDPAIEAALVRAGYVLRVDEPEHRMFRTPERDVHVHLWVAGTADVTRHVEFRDRLRASAAHRRAYAELKHELATREWRDVNDYADAKGALIESILGSSRMDVELREITAETVRDVCAIEVAEDQRGFVESNAVSIAEAHFTPQHWMRAIYAGGRLAGFLLTYEAPGEPAYLWRFMVAAGQQRRGIGRRALELLLDHWRDTGATRGRLSVEPENTGGIAFYESLGFRLTGEREHGELVMAREL